MATSSERELLELLVKKMGKALLLTEVLTNYA